jgi:uncharacterized membrane protein SirB2
MIINPKNNLIYTFQYCIGVLITSSYTFSKFHSKSLWFDISLILVITLCVIGTIVSGYKLYKLYKHDQS